MSGAILLTDMRIILTDRIEMSMNGYGHRGGDDSPLRGKPVLHLTSPAYDENLTLVFAGGDDDCVRLRDKLTAWLERTR